MYKQKETKVMETTIRNLIKEAMKERNKKQTDYVQKYLRKGSKDCKRNKCSSDR